MSAVRFFFSWAGWSYDPKTETSTQGRWKCARALAKVESYANEVGLRFEWSIDETCDSSEFSEEKPRRPLWVCCAIDQRGKTVASCGGIDFGRRGEPWGKPYKRVMEAELASEAEGGR